MKDRKENMMKHKIILLDADTRLKQICLEKAESKYGSPLPDIVYERLEKELKAIQTSGYASQYLLGAMIAEYSLKNGYSVSSRGLIGSVFVAYLCGISGVSPLKAHYCCPKCHHFETVEAECKDHRIMGYDLPDKVCPVCGVTINGDGADIEPEISMGIELDREPSIILNVAAEIRPKIVEYIVSILGESCIYRAGTKAMKKDGSIKRGVHPGGVFIIPKGADIQEITEIRKEIPEDDFRLPVTERDYHEINDVLIKLDLFTFKELSMLARLEKETGLSVQHIKTNDKAVLYVFQKEGLSFLPQHITTGSAARNLQDDVIRMLEPECFSDLVRIISMMHGVEVWNENAELLIYNGKSIRDCISSRDQIMEDLLRTGMPRKKAFEIMDSVRKGKGITEEMEWDMLSAGIPDWYIESCRKIVYLFPKAHTVEFMLIYWRLAYYRLHFPDEYKEALQALEENEGAPW